MVKDFAKLKVTTSWHYPNHSNSVWPLLFNSKLNQSGSFMFSLGIPQPLECRLTKEEGGVGIERECVSNKGIIHQRILVWEPNTKLSFKMEWAEFNLKAGTVGMEDSFNLVDSERGVSITRSTFVDIRGPFVWFKKSILRIGLKKIHKHVFSNWGKILSTNTAD